MSNSRFITTNYATAAAATIKNGTGGPAPALEQETPYTMARALSRDRYSYWRTSAAPVNPTPLDIDLGSAIDIDTLGLLGFRAAALAAATTVTVQSGTVYNTWATLGTFSFSSNPRDKVLTFGSTSMRYVRFSIACTSQFQVGKALAGAMVDLGAAHGPGALSSPYRFRNEQVLVGGSVVVEDLGDVGRDLSISLPQATEARRSVIEALVNQTGTFVYLDPYDQPYEVFIPGGARIDVQRMLYAGSASIHSVDLRLVRLP